MSEISETVTPCAFPGVTLYAVRVYTDDDASSTTRVYFESRDDAERYLSALPEATR